MRPRSGQVCCLFLVALLAARHPQPAERIAPHAALALLVAGYALTLYQAVGDSTPPFLASVAGALFGCGQGACFLCWFLVYARMEPTRVARAMVASTMLSGAVILAIGLIPDTVMLFSALSLIVAGCSALMYYCLGRREDVHRRTGAPRPSAGRRGALALRARARRRCARPGPRYRPSARDACL